MTERSEAVALDEHDPLRSYRDRFAIDDADLIYLDGNSLGRLPRATVTRLAHSVEWEWGRGLVRSWHEWVDLPTAVGDRLGRAALGAGAGQVVVADNTTTNLFKLVHAALDLIGDDAAVLVVDPEEFPTDRYVVEGIGTQRGVAVVPGLVHAGARRPVVVRSHVDFRSGAVADMVPVTDQVRAAGGEIVWDLSHSAGAIEIDLDGAGVSFAAGCTYKYLNAGPGAPGYLYVRRDLQPEVRQPIWGWFGQREQFAMGPSYEPETDVRRFLTGTPSPLLLHAVDEGVALVEEAGLAAIAAKARALTRFAAGLGREWLEPLGFAIASPADPARRGAHLALRHAEGWAVNCALIEVARVVPDFRPPDVLRFGFPPLYTRFVDVWDAFNRLRDLVERGVHHTVDTSPRRVT